MCIALASSGQVKQSAVYALCFAAFLRAYLETEVVVTVELSDLRLVEFVK